MAETLDRRYDKRVMDRHLKRNELDQKDVEKMIKALPDLKDEMETMVTSQVDLDPDFELGDDD